MNLFIYGSSSFIAKNFIKYIVNKKKIKNIFLFDKKKDNEFYDLLCNVKKTHFFKIDLSKGSLSNFFDKYKPTHLINFAAETHVDKSIQFPENFYYNNIKIVTNLLSDLKNYQNKKNKIKFIHISTDEVFGSLKLKDNIFTEYSNYNPLNPYSASKASCDLIIKSHFNTYGLNFLIVHLSNNFGPFQNIEKLIPYSLFNIIHNRKIPIYGKGNNVRDWLFVKDTAKILYKLLNSNLSGNICVGGDNEINNLKLIKIIISTYNNITNANLDIKGSIKYVADRPGHDFRYALSNDRLKKYFLWDPSKNFHNKMKETISWYLENKKIFKIMNNKSFSKWSNLNYNKR
jgi:dTDP-glucose 4,6-dehydratase